MSASSAPLVFKNRGCFVSSVRIQREAAFKNKSAEKEGRKGEKAQIKDSGRRAERQPGRQRRQLLHHHRDVKPRRGDKPQRGTSEKHKLLPRIFFL